MSQYSSLKTVPADWQQLLHSCFCTNYTSQFFCMNAICLQNVCKRLFFSSMLPLYNISKRGNLSLSYFLLQFFADHSVFNTFSMPFQFSDVLQSSNNDGDRDFHIFLKSMIGVILFTQQNQSSDKKAKYCSHVPSAQIIYNYPNKLHPRQFLLPRHIFPHPVQSQRSQAL